MNKELIDALDWFLEDTPRLLISTAFGANCGNFDVSPNYIATLCRKRLYAEGYIYSAKRSDDVVFRRVVSRYKWRLNSI